ncbi:MAG: hypothetical protein V4760_18255 [Bdellovibrionota bacterium]
MMSFARNGLALFVACLSVTAIASSITNAEADRLVNLVGDTAYGVSVHKVKGATAEEMIRNLAESEGSDLEDFVVMAPSSDLDFGDQSGWGTIGVDGARDLYSWMDAKTNDDGDELEGWGEDLAKADAALETLSASGFEFGFTDGSSSYCGVSFMGLLIVDVKNGIVYEVRLTSSGSC